MAFALQETFDKWSQKEKKKKEKREEKKGGSWFQENLINENKKMGK